MVSSRVEGFRGEEVVARGDCGGAFLDELPLFFKAEQQKKRIIRNNAEPEKWKSNQKLLHFNIFPLFIFFLFRTWAKIHVPGLKRDE